MANTDSFDFQVLQLVNAERAKSGLNPLTLNEKLDVAADRYSERMALGDFFSHSDPYDGSSIGTRVAQTGYRYTSVGENLAYGQTTPEAVVQAWMNSPGHRKNILNPKYTHMGLGYFYLNPDGGNIRGQHYWTQVFGAGDTNSGGSIGGGNEQFIITNNTSSRVFFNIDGTEFSLAAGYYSNYTTGQGGMISFDSSFDPGYQQSNYDLNNGGNYQFLARGSSLDLFVA